MSGDGIIGIAIVVGVCLVWGAYVVRRVMDR